VSSAADGAGESTCERAPRVRRCISPLGSGIISRPAQIPGVAQRRLVLGAPGMARERGGVGERQALTPQGAARVIVAGDRMQGGERGAGEKARVFVGLGHAAARAHAGNDGTEGGGGKVIRARAMDESGRARRFWPVKRPQSAVGVGG
jgi:hypothetical protein